jgi:hypothetical protein
MTAALTHADPRILLIGDNRFLLELVAANLVAAQTLVLLLPQHDGGTHPESVAALPSHEPQVLRLVVLALSHTNHEPVIMLAQAGLTHLVGAIPLLIISDRTFAADPERNIFHLPFPFRAEVLRQQVADLLAPRDLARLSTKEV